MTRLVLLIVFWFAVGAFVGVIPYISNVWSNVRLYMAVSEVVDPETVFNVHRIAMTSNGASSTDRLNLLILMDEKTQKNDLFKPYRKHIVKIMNQLGQTTASLQKMQNSAKEDRRSFDLSSEIAKEVPSNVHLSIIRETAARVNERIDLELYNRKNGGISRDDAYRVSIPGVVKKDKLLEHVVILTFFPVENAKMMDIPFTWKGTTSSPEPQPVKRVVEKTAKKGETMPPEKAPAEPAVMPENKKDQ